MKQGDQSLEIGKGEIRVFEISSRKRLFHNVSEDALDSGGLGYRIHTYVGLIITCALIQMRNGVQVGEVGFRESWSGMQPSTVSALPMSLLSSPATC
jgi:hypothetical protein